MTGEAKTWARALDNVKRHAHLTLPGLIEQLAATYDERLALIGDTEALTYRSLAARTNNYARWAMNRGIAGTKVALLMHNCPDYVAIWLGLTRVGCTVALLNTNLRSHALSHCINISCARHLIASDDLVPVVDRGSTLVEIVRWPLGTSEISDCSPVDAPLPDLRTVALLVYTSGTTGMPKAAKVTHRRVTEWSFWFAGMTNATQNDRLYNCLPMYHSIGGIVAIGSMLVCGASVVIRPRFSSSRFWRDVVQLQCTIFQYIGELCRYLLAQVPPSDGPHQLRLAVGNGLEADVWQAFQERFAIPQILEYYAATEGVLSLYNCEGKPGSIGRIPPMLEAHFAVKLIRVDQETGQPVRNAAGFCVVSGTDKPGEAICLIRDDRAFDGYNDPGASRRKILEGVFANGDSWYRTNDLMRQDARGYYYFVDRLGDTFRWKGENVSTREVANVVRSCPGVLAAIVYGVFIEGREGRAGMVAITMAEGFSFEQFMTHIHEHLPAYARPVFVRTCKSLDTTGTFKLAKGRFAAEGYMHSSDPVYVYEPRTEAFVLYGTVYGND